MVENTSGLARYLKVLGVVSTRLNLHKAEDRERLWGLIKGMFFLGDLESLVAPAFTIVTAMWWKQSEQPLRLYLWYTSTGLGGLLGPILLFGIGHIHGLLHHWKHHYLILGAVTVVWGVSLFWLLPDSPVKASFLDQTERSIAVKRIELSGV
jgi:sugar phosphate permease